MVEKRPIGAILQEALEAIEEVGGPDRHMLREVIGKPAYEKLISKAKGADLIDRWLNATGKAKGPATKALSVAIAKVADRPELISRIEREIGDAFDISPAEKLKKTANSRETSKRAPAPAETKKHAEAVRQAKNDQRPMPTNLVALAKGDDASRYIKARRSAD
jgi:hypothetical protein